MTDERAVILVKKVTYSGEFSYLNGSCIRITVLFLRFLVLWEINSRFCSKTQWQMFLLISGPPCWCPSRWAPTWCLHTNLYKFGENVSPHISHKKNCCDLNLGESLCISIIFLFPDSRLNLLNGFDFLFWSILNGVTLKTSSTNLLSPLVWMQRMNS